MQLQMEVCNLDTCDFLETLIKEYDDEEAFFTDSYHTRESSSSGEVLSPYTHTSKGQLKGIIMYFSSSSGPIYEYMPLYSTQEDYEKWSNKMFEKHQNVTWLKNLYWYMKEYSCVVVERNRSWFDHAIVLIEDTWKQIEVSRLNGVGVGKAKQLPSRPKTRSRSNSTIEDFPVAVDPTITGCLLNLDAGDCVSVVVDEVRHQPPSTTTVDEVEETTGDEHFVTVSHEGEMYLMSQEDKMSTIRDVLISLLERCEDIIKKKEEDNVIVMATTSTSSKEQKKTGSPVTRSSSTKPNKDRKEKKKDENVIYVIT